MAYVTPVFFSFLAFLNMSKTEYVIYGLHQRLKRKESIILSCNGSSVTKSDSFMIKYLCVVIDEHLSFNSHIELVVKKVWGNWVFLGVWEFLFPWQLLNAFTRRWFYLFLITVMWPGTAVVKLSVMYARAYSIELRRYFLQILVSMLKSWMLLWV